MVHPEPAPKHDHHLLKFPDNFLWGAATSAYQVEGNNIYADWWKWEQEHQTPSLRSGIACDHYNKYQEDFQLAADFGHSAHRLSVEWSRIEPHEGEFNFEAIEHYKDVLKSLKSHHMKVMLTLWHFTLPLWIAEKGGWNNPKTIDYFLRFLEKIVPELKDHVDFWITLNEPGLYVYQLYDSKEWPGAEKGMLKQLRMMLNLASAHKQAYTLLKKLTPTTPVGIANNLQSFEATHKHSFSEQAVVMFSDFMTNHLFYTMTSYHHDFIGVNYYFHNRIRHFSLSDLFKKKPNQIVNFDQSDHEVSDLGWEIFPEGIFEVLADMSDHIPIYITECGIASTNDDRRTRFLINYLSEIYRAIEEGINVKGFFYWSLIDNFEWHRGFDPRFGLIEIDYKTLKRTPRPSATVYKDIIHRNGIPHKLLKLLGHTIQVEEVLKSI